MADKNDNAELYDLPSVQEYSESIADQEAPQPLPEREYPVECDGARYRLTKDKTKKMIEVKVSVDKANFPHDYKSSREKVNLTTFIMADDVDWCRYAIGQLFQAFGLPKPGRKIDPNDLLGKNAMAVVVHEEFNGRKIERIKEFKKRV